MLVNLKKNRFLFIVNAAILIVVLYSLNRSIGILPALLPLLNPASGLWNHQLTSWKEGPLSGPKENVDVALDSNGVFHIYAQNDFDLYFTQGYLTASKRLFQMDLSTRVTAGRLSELVGKKGLDFDRYFIEFGMREYSRRTIEKILDDPHSKMAVEAYLQGVNLWIDQLNVKTLPPEYKILNTWPKKFEPIRVAHLLLLMSYNLAGRSYDLEQTQFRIKHGLKKAQQLFPDEMPQDMESFIVTESYVKGSVNDSVWLDYLPQINNFPQTFMPHPSNGSNNFAVGPKRSATGRTIIANDTHLGYSLPNVWIENHLVSPTQNVYGVSFPMGPGVVLGFTKTAAWAVTNGTTDVLDWFEVEFRNETSLDYRWGDEWLTANQQLEIVNVPHSSPVEIQVLETKAGFILKREGKWGLAARWVGSEVGNELSAILKLDKAKDFFECQAALENWQVPIQNWICADQENIGIFHRGFIPLRAKGEGHFIEPARPTVWQNSIPLSELPQEINPESGVVRSANQRVVPPDYKYYLGWDYEDPIRGSTILSELTKTEKISSQNLIELQNNVTDETAREGLSLMLNFLNRNKLNNDQIAAVQILEKWNYVTLAKGIETTIYKSWWRELRKGIFLKHNEDQENPVNIPRWRMQLLLRRLTKNPLDLDSQWVDQPGTAEREVIGDLVTDSFLNSWSELEKLLGADTSQWIFSRLQKTEFPHVAKIPGFGIGAEVDGTSYSVRANAGVHGPVYKMVVELGDQPRAWSMVPGGMDGNPFSKTYGRDIKDWSSGKMKEVKFLQSIEEAKTSGATLIRFFSSESEQR